MRPKTRGRFAPTLLLLPLLAAPLPAEPLRVLIEGSQEASLEKALEGPDASQEAVALSYAGAAVITLAGDLRFFRGVQIELQAPQSWLAYYGSLAAGFYLDLTPPPEAGTADLEARRLSFDPLPGKVQNTWLIPLRASSGLKNSPYAALLDQAAPESFPLLFRLTPVIKGISEELENMRFLLRATPILGEEGAVRLDFRYPPQLPGRPVTVLIDDVVIDNPREELLLKEGDHHLVVLSEDYRSQSRRFRVERARVLDLLVELEDPTPLVVFERPENALIFLDGLRVENPGAPLAVEPGSHEIRIQLGDYTIIRPLQAERGKTYRVALSLDLVITERE